MDYLFAALGGAAVFRARRRNALARVGAVIIPRRAEFEAKLAALVRGGPSRLQVIADFDRTVTAASVDGRPGLSCHGVIEHCELLTPRYRAAMHAAYLKYRAYETDPSLSVAQKLPYMRAWYGYNHGLLVAEDFRRADIAAAVRQVSGGGGGGVRQLALRPGCAQVISSLQKARVPLLLFSAGLADVLAEIMAQHFAEPLAPSTFIVSNQMRWAGEEGEAEGVGGEEVEEEEEEEVARRGPRLVGFSEPLLHMFNKDFSALRGTPYAAAVGGGGPNNHRRPRPHVLLLGDGIGDAAMADGLDPPPDAVLRVGFLNSRVESSLPQFSEAFDVVVLNDGPMDAVLDIVRAVLAGGQGGAEGEEKEGEEKEEKGKKAKRKQYKEEVLPEARQAELTQRVDSWHAIAKQQQQQQQQQQPGSNTAPAAAPLHFEASLTAGERKFVHALCEARGSELSSKSEGAGAARHVVVYDAPVEEGVVGGVSAPRRAELAARVDAWMKAERQAGAGKLHFEPTLTTAEREFVHQVAAQNGLSSKSEGKDNHGGADWHIAVTARTEE
jgi:5'-nucleotidase